MHNLAELVQEAKQRDQMSSDARYEQYAIGEMLIAAAEDCPELSKAAFTEALRVGSRIIRNANRGIVDTAVQA